MSRLGRAAIVLGLGLGLFACGDDRDNGPCGVDACPAYVDCQPVVAPENQCLCSTEGQEWMGANCQGTQYVW